jgi:hypothetical protein
LHKVLIRVPAQGRNRVSIHTPVLGVTTVAKTVPFIK